MTGFSPQNTRMVDSTAFGNSSIASSVDVQNVPSASRDALEKLDPSQLQRVRKMKSELLVINQNALVNFDSSIHNEITKLADETTSQTKSSDLDIIGDKLTNIIILAKGINVGVEPTSKIPLLGGMINKFRNTKERVAGQFDTVGEQITKIITEVDAMNVKLLSASKLQDQLFNLNAKQYKELDLMTISAKMALEELQAQTDDFIARMGETPDPFDVQQVNDAQAYMSSLDMKIHNWELLKASSFQLAPAIRQIQLNGLRLIERFKLVKTHVIPVWKRQFMVAVMVEDQAKGTALDTAITNASNEMSVRTATLLKQTSIDVARASQRGVLDMATIEHIQNELISGIDEVVSITKEGAQKRQEANRRLAEMQTQLQTKLIQRN